MTVMTDNEVINEAKEAAEYLRMQISEAEMQYQRVFKLHKLIETLLKITKTFRSFGVALMLLKTFEISSDLINLCASFVRSSYLREQLENIGRVLRVFLSDISPVKEPLSLGLSLFIASWVFMYLFRLIDQSLISPEEVSNRFEDQLEKARSLLQSLEQELNELYAEGGL
ncbi:MAG: hypothetical protein QNJ42_00885 [Crocosphaera sp.]|nr:hypothetical protein [Crocosphaera sp.]